MDGFELNESVFNEALETSHNERILFRNIDWLDVYEDEQYDTIVAFEVFEHINAPMQDIVRHTYKCLRPGGTLIGSLPIMQGKNRFHLAGDMTIRQCVVAFCPPGAEWESTKYLYQYPDEIERPWRNLSVFDLVEPFDDVVAGIVVFVGVKPE